VSANLQLNAWTDSSCTIPDSRYASVKLPNYKLPSNGRNCISSTGVSGFASNVQWLGFICNSPANSSALLLEYSYSINNECPYNYTSAVSPIAGANWSVSVGGFSSATCRPMQFSQFNATTNSNTFSFVSFGSFICTTSSDSNNSVNQFEYSFASLLTLTLCCMILLAGIY